MAPVHVSQTEFEVLWLVCEGPWEPLLCMLHERGTSLQVDIKIQTHTALGQKVAAAAVYLIKHALAA